MAASLTHHPASQSSSVCRSEPNCGQFAPSRVPPTAGRLAAACAAFRAQVTELAPATQRSTRALAGWYARTPGRSRLDPAPAVIERASSETAADRGAGPRRVFVTRLDSRGRRFGRTGTGPVVLWRPYHAGGPEPARPRQRPRPNPPPGRLSHTTNRPPTRPPRQRGRAAALHAARGWMQREVHLHPPPRDCRDRPLCTERTAVARNQTNRREQPAEAEWGTAHRDCSCCDSACSSIKSTRHQPLAGMKNGHADWHVGACSLSAVIPPGSPQERTELPSCKMKTNKAARGRG